MASKAPEVDDEAAARMRAECLAKGDRYVVTNIGLDVGKKESATRYDIVEALATDIYDTGGGRSVVWFLAPGSAFGLFGKGTGVYMMRILADGRGTRPVGAAYIGQPSWPDVPVG